jgi:predicted DCC family thiol-disulfide oxidoreductase YuxK
VTGSELYQLVVGAVVVGLAWLRNLPGWVWLALLAIFVLWRGLRHIGNGLHAIARARLIRRKEPTEDDD